MLSVVAPLIPVAPFVPVITATGAIISAFFILIVLGWLLEQMGLKIPIIGDKIRGALGSILNAVETRVTEFARQAQAPVANLIIRVQDVLSDLAVEIGRFADETEDAIKFLRNVEIGKRISARLAPIFAEISRINKAIRDTMATAILIVEKLRDELDAFKRNVTNTIRRPLRKLEEIDVPNLARRVITLDNRINVSIEPKVSEALERSKDAQSRLNTIETRRLPALENAVTAIRASIRDIERENIPELREDIALLRRNLRDLQAGQVRVRSELIDTLTRIRNNLIVSEIAPLRTTIKTLDLAITSLERTTALEIGRIQSDISATRQEISRLAPAEQLLALTGIVAGIQAVVQNAVIPNAEILSQNREKFVRQCRIDLEDWEEFAEGLVPFVGAFSLASVITLMQEVARDTMTPLRELISR